MHLDDRIKPLETTESVLEMDSEIEELTKVKLLKEDGEGAVSDEAVGTASSIAKEPELSKRCDICSTLVFLTIGVLIRLFTL